MKKLMVLAAVAATAIASQAAQFNWGADRGKLSNYKNQTVYCVYGDNVATALQVLTDGGANVSSDFMELVGSQATVAAGGSITALNAYDAASTAAFFVFANNLIADGSTYDTTGAMDVSSYLYTPPENMPKQLKLEDALFTSTGNPIGVPEPTSGLLLLLGVAGMALRRRRA